jgi:hypothetical protein
MTNVPDSMKDPPFAMFVGPNRYFLHYPLRHQTTMNVIAVGREPRWQEEGWKIPATHSRPIATKIAAGSALEPA